jgi:hypothetical protein
MMEYQAYKELIEGLPEEFEPVRCTLMGNLANREWDQVLPTIKAIAYMIGYSDKSRSEEAASNLVLNRGHGPELGPGPAAPGNRPGAGQQQRPRSPAKERKPPFCKRCRQTTHLQRDCPKAKEEEAFKARMEHVAARIDHLELQLGEALPHMANAARGHSSSGSTRDPEGDWPAPTHPGENFHALSTTLYARSQPPTNLAWLLDGGASIHLMNNSQYLHNPVVYQSPKPLHLATSDAVGGIIAKGSVCLLDARGAQLWLHDVQCVPAATTNLISVSAAIRDGCQFRTDSKGAHVLMMGPEARECEVNMSTGLYYLQRIQCRSRQVPRAALVPNSAGPIQLPHNCQQRDLWHRRLGHPGATVMFINTREGLISGLPVSLLPRADCSPACEACLQGNLPRPPFPNSTRPASRVLERIHLVTVGELPDTALTGEKYWVTVLDEASHCVAAIPVKSKIFPNN